MFRTERRWPDRLEFQLGWALLGTLIGLGYAIGGVSPAARMLLPGWLIPVWVAALLCSGLAEAGSALVGATTVRRERRRWGLIVERASLTMQSASVLTIGLASVYVWDAARALPRESGVTAPPFPVIGVSLVLVWLAINVMRDRRIAFLTKPIKPAGPAESAAVPHPALPQE